MVRGQSGPQLTAKLSDSAHEWSSGLEKALGGDDSAPDPHRLLESALAACTILTVELYAKRKGWPLEKVEASVEIVSEGEPVNKIRRTVKFHGNLDGEQRARLAEIAGKCPIHRYLQRATEIETTI